MITTTPTAYEIYDDEAQEMLAKVVAFDEGASSVEITTIVNPKAWTALSDAIYIALCNMHPEKAA